MDEAKEHGGDETESREISLTKEPPLAEDATSDEIKFTREQPINKMEQNENHADPRQLCGPVHHELTKKQNSHNPEKIGSQFLLLAQFQHGTNEQSYNKCSKNYYKRIFKILIEITIGCTRNRIHRVWRGHPRCLTSRNLVPQTQFMVLKVSQSPFGITPVSIAWHIRSLLQNWGSCP